MFVKIISVCKKTANTGASVTPENTDAGIFLYPSYRNYLELSSNFDRKWNRFDNHEISSG